MDREVKGGKRTDPLPSVPLKKRKVGDIYEYPLEFLTARSLVSAFHTLLTAFRFLQRCAFARQEGEEVNTTEREERNVWHILYCALFLHKKAIKYNSI